jgi:hypothetical protein
MMPQALNHRTVSIGLAVKAMILMFMKFMKFMKSLSGNSNDQTDFRATIKTRAGIRRSLRWGVL